MEKNTLNCAKCEKDIEDDKFFTLAKTHGKFFLVPGIMKGSYTSENLIYCEDCSKTIDLNELHF